MSTTGIESWAVDLANIGPIYPFQGTEVLMAIVGIALWIVWHIWQMRFESRSYEEERKKLQDPKILDRAMRDRRLD